MINLIIGVVILLVVIIIVLMIYNMQIHKKIENYTNINQKITSLSVLQDFMDTISESSSVDDKIKKINDILIERYDIKYSTIVVFNGTKYVLKASNVDEKHWGPLQTYIHNQSFKIVFRQQHQSMLQLVQKRKDYHINKWNSEEQNQLCFSLYILKMYISVIGLLKVVKHMHLIILIQLY